MTLLCKPIGPGNWAIRRFACPGQPDLTLVGRRIEIRIPGLVHRLYWVRGGGALTTQHKTDCTGKRVFTRFGQAQRSAKRRNRNDGGAHLEAYHCRHCNAFHVGEARSHGRLDKRREAV